MSAVTEAEFEVDGQTYRSTRMSVFDQQTVASKLGGVLLLMGSDEQDHSKAKKPKTAPTDKKAPTEEDFVRAFCALSGEMRKQDSDLVLGLCLSNVKRKEAGDIGWAPIRIDGGLIAFEDINLKEMLLIVWQVLKQHRIPDFFSVPRSPSRG